MINSLRENILFIFQHANLIDYLVYGWILLAFIFVLFLGLFIAARSWWQFGFLIILADFVAVFVAFYIANLELAKRFRPVELSEIHTKQLQFSNNLLVDFNITNNSNKTYGICKIDIGFYVVSKQEIRTKLNSFNPFATKNIIIKEPIFPRETREINDYVGNFAFIDYNMTTRTECFE